MRLAAHQFKILVAEAEDMVTECMTDAQLAEARKLAREYWKAYGPARDNQQIKVKVTEGINTDVLQACWSSDCSQFQ